MIWTLVHGNEDKAPFFMRSHVAGNPDPSFPLPLQHGEHSVQDPIGIFQGIPLEPPHLRRAVNLKKLEEERTRHQQREQELTENFQAALKEQTDAFATTAARLERQLVGQATFGANASSQQIGYPGFTVPGMRNAEVASLGWNHKMIGPPL